MTAHPSIAYRSPTGRVHVYSKYGRLVFSCEPGPEADKAWGELSPRVPKHENASWIDRAESKVELAQDAQQELFK